ncbi:MAG: DUF2017 family protein [Acidimicrobiales bacterium]
MARFTRRVRRTRRGTYAIGLPQPERELLVSLVDQLREVLEVSTDDPSVRRLFPTAYHEDPERDREYQQLVRDELLERRLAALAIVEESAAAEEVDETQLTAWLTALNDLRLVLGTRLDVSEDQDAGGLEELDEDDPRTPAMVVYHYLSGLLDEIVTALAADLPAPTEPEM